MEKTNYPVGKQLCKHIKQAITLKYLIFPIFADILYNQNTYRQSWRMEIVQKLQTRNYNIGVNNH